MKKIILSIVLLVATLMANEIQVFSSNTMRLQITKDMKFKQLYLGTSENFYKNAKIILNKFDIGNAVFSASSDNLSSTVQSNNLATTGSLDLNSVATSAGIGLTLGLTAYGIAKSVNWFIHDNEYLSMILATNKNNNATIIAFYIVANNYLSDSELKNISDKRLEMLKGIQK